MSSFPPGSPPKTAIEPDTTGEATGGGIDRRIRTAVRKLAASPRLPKILAWGWTLALLQALLQPSPGIPSPFPHVDKVVHLALFGGYALLWSWAGVRARTIALWGFVIAAATEVAQAWFTTDRNGDVEDFVVNNLGLALGLLLSTLLDRHRRIGADAPRMPQ